MPLGSLDCRTGLDCQRKHIPGRGSTCYKWGFSGEPNTCPLTKPLQHHFTLHSFHITASVLSLLLSLLNSGSEPQHILVHCYVVSLVTVSHYWYPTLRQHPTHHLLDLNLLSAASIYRQAIIYLFIFFPSKTPISRSCLNFLHLAFVSQQSSPTTG